VRAFVEQPLGEFQQLSQTIPALGQIFARLQKRNRAAPRRSPHSASPVSISHSRPARKLSCSNPKCSSHAAPARRSPPEPPLRQYQAIGAWARLVVALSPLASSFSKAYRGSFQHHEARFAVRLLDLLYQTFVDHGCHAVQQIQIEITSRVADRFHPFQIATPHKHRQSAEELLLGRLNRS